MAAVLRLTCRAFAGNSSAPCLQQWSGFLGVLEEARLVMAFDSDLLRRWVFLLGVPLFGRCVDIRSLDERGARRVMVTTFVVMGDPLEARDENRARIFCHGFWLGIGAKKSEVRAGQGYQVDAERPPGLGTGAR
jgi:hypothetical protein